MRDLRAMAAALEENSALAEILRTRCDKASGREHVPKSALDAFQLLGEVVSHGFHLFAPSVLAMTEGTSKQNINNMLSRGQLLALTWEGYAPYRYIVADLGAAAEPVEESAEAVDASGWLQTCLPEPKAEAIESPAVTISMSSPWCAIKQTLLDEALQVLPLEGESVVLYAGDEFLQFCRSGNVWSPCREGVRHSNSCTEGRGGSCMSAKRVEKILRKLIAIQRERQEVPPAEEWGDVHPCDLCRASRTCDKEDGCCDREECQDTCTGARQACSQDNSPSQLQSRAKAFRGLGLMPEPKAVPPAEAPGDDEEFDKVCPDRQCNFREWCKEQEGGPLAICPDAKRQRQEETATAASKPIDELMAKGFSRDEAKILLAGFDLLRYDREAMTIWLAETHISWDSQEKKFAPDPEKEAPYWYKSAKSPFTTYAEAERTVKKILADATIEVTKEGHTVHRHRDLLDDGFDFYRSEGIIPGHGTPRIKCFSKNWGTWKKFDTPEECQKAWDELMLTDKALHG